MPLDGGHERSELPLYLVRRAICALPLRDASLLAPSAPRMTLSNTRLRRLLAALVLLLLAALWLSAYALLERTREGELQAANARMEGRTAIFSAYIRSVFAHLDAVLVDLRDHVGPDGKLAESEAARHLKDLEGYSRQISIIDADGRLHFSTLGTRSVDLSDREQFKFHRDAHDSDQLYITRPVKGRISGEWTIFATRALKGPNGFGGVLQVSISPEVFAKFAKELVSRNDDIFALVRSSGELISTFPEAGPRLGAVLQGIPILEPDAPAFGTFLQQGLDGVRRFYAYSALPDYGVIAVTGRSEAGVLKNFEIRKRRIYIAASCITTLLLAMLWALWFALKRNDQIQLQLEQAARQAEAANEEKTRFLATMSHELRTPLNGVVGLSQLLLETPLDSKQQEFAVGIARSGQEVVALVNDILDLSKIEAGRVDLDPQPYRISECIDAIRDMFGNRAIQKGVALRVATHASAEGTYLGDLHRIRQVLINLVGNALKFTDQGEVALEVWSANDMLVFEVTDTGVGIPAESRERIFERFTQVDMSNARRYAGTGLGLAICRQLVEAMGGSIVCDARGEGPGTVFKVRLPAIKVDSPAAAVEPQITQPRLPEPEPSHVPEGNHHTAQPCLLVVEDNPVNQKVVMLMLERLGYRAEVANDGESALAAAQRRTYATILMDVRMPGMDGMEVTRRLRAGTGPNARTPVIAVTANALQAERDECMASGMNDFLSKPLILETLSARVAYWVGMGAHQPTQSSAHGDRAP